MADYKHNDIATLFDLNGGGGGGGEENVIESVAVNGTALPVSDKAVNIDLSGYATTGDISPLVITVDNGTLNHTWNEISNAMKSGRSVYYDDEADGVWVVTKIGDNGEGYFVDIQNMFYIAQTKNDYPSSDF